MQRFYVSFPLTIDVVLQDQDIIHQITRVLRSKIGEEVILFDGDGSETLYQIEKIEKKSISLRWIHRVFPNTEPKRKIALYQAMPNKLEKLEFILQKWIEVGISGFIFFRSDYSQKLVLSETKKSRLSSIAREALEQCGWLSLPRIDFLDGWPETGKENIVCLDTIGRKEYIIKAGEGNKDIGLFVGPEWGWSQSERNQMEDKGFIFAQFWERVMRTETAGVVVAFALIHQ